MRVIRLTAKPDWKGIFHIGWVKSNEKKTGLSISFGKKVFVFVK